MRRSVLNPVKVNGHGAMPEQHPFGMPGEVPLGIEGPKDVTASPKRKTAMMKRLSSLKSLGSFRLGSFKSKSKLGVDEAADAYKDLQKAEIPEPFHHNQSKKFDASVLKKEQERARLNEWEHAEWNQYLGAIRIQRFYRGWRSRVRVRKMRLDIVNKGCAMYAMPGTEHGYSGWYQVDNEVFHVRKVSPVEGAHYWKVMVGPMTERQWWRFVFKAQRSEVMLACPGTKAGTSGYYIDDELEVLKFHVSESGEWSLVTEEEVVRGSPVPSPTSSPPPPGDHLWPQLQLHRQRKDKSQGVQGEEEPAEGEGEAAGCDHAEDDTGDGEVGALGEGGGGVRRVL